VSITREVGSLGRTHLYTRWEVRFRAFAAVLSLLGAAAATVVGMAVTALVTGADQVWPAVTFRPVIGGDGALLDATGTSTAHLQLPVAISWPPLDPWWPAVLVALPLFALWMRYVVSRLLQRFDGNLRHPGRPTSGRRTDRTPPGSPGNTPCPPAAPSSGSSWALPRWASTSVRRKRRRRAASSG